MYSLPITGWNKVLSCKIQIWSLKRNFTDVASPHRLVSFYRNISFSFYQEQRKTRCTEKKNHIVCMDIWCGPVMTKNVSQNCWRVEIATLRSLNFIIQHLGNFCHLNFSILLQIITKPQKSRLEIIPQMNKGNISKYIKLLENTISN